MLKRWKDLVVRRMGLGSQKIEEFGSQEEKDMPRAVRRPQKHSSSRQVTQVSGG